MTHTTTAFLKSLTKTAVLRVLFISLAASMTGSLSCTDGASSIPLLITCSSVKLSPDNAPDFNASFPSFRLIASDRHRFMSSNPTMEDLELRDHWPKFQMHIDPFKVRLRWLAPTALQACAENACQPWLLRHRRRARSASL